MRGVLLIIGTILFSSCTQESCRESVSPVSIQLEVERLEDELFNTNTSAEVTTFLKKHHSFSKLFLNADQYPTDSVLAKRIFNLINNPSIDTLYGESIAAFSNFEEVIQKLENGLGRLKQYYPETKIPKVQTVVTGLYRDLFISNEHIMIGMDFFVGSDATYKPVDIPNYILRRYDTEHLPSIILKFISSQHISPGKGDALLTEMIDYGKNYYLLSKLLPCTPEHILIGYTEEEWNDVFDNEGIIWANFIQNEWLYETNHTIKQKFLGERPNVYEIGDKCPGRIGTWVGWQIVNAYMEKFDISVQELMEEKDHQKIFTLSGYKPG